MEKNIWKFYLVLTIICALAFLTRLYRLGAPLADWHSWRQSDTAAVARNFETRGIDIFHPRYDDLSNIQSGKDNPEGFRMVELPVYQVVGVGVHSLAPQLSLEASLRLVSAMATTFSVFLLGVLLFLFVGRIEAIVGALAYAVMPYSIYYGRTILPDSFAVFWALLSLVLLACHTQRYRWLFLISAAVSAAISLLVRPMAGFLLLPAVYFILRQGGFSFSSLIRLFVYSFISLLPFIWWRGWITQFPEGIPVNEWLFNNNGIRFKGAWFYWLFAKRLSELMLGFWGLIPFGVGLAVRSKGKDIYISLLWIFGLLAYFIVFAGGNVQHDYYQALVIPIVVWFVAKGAGFLLREVPGLYRFSAITMLAVSFFLAWAFSWYTIRTYYWINRPEIVEAGIAADGLLPKDAKVIASYNGDTTFLYQTKRQGWPLGFDIPQKIAMGATHYVTVSTGIEDGETQALASEYTVLVMNDRYAIIDLTKMRQKDSQKLR